MFLFLYISDNPTPISHIYIYMIEWTNFYNFVFCLFLLMILFSVRVHLMMIMMMGNNTTTRAMFGVHSSQFCLIRTIYIIHTDKHTHTQIRFIYFLFLLVFFCYNFSFVFCMHVIVRALSTLKCRARVPSVAAWVCDVIKT